MLFVLIAMAASATTVSSCGALKQAGRTYLLQNDVSSDGTCFSVQADDITLDLNGHTVTYGRGGGKYARYGVVGMACWDPDLKNGAANGNPCGGTWNRLTVRNGAISEEDPTAPPYSHAIRISPGSGEHASIHDLTLRVGSTSSVPVWILSSRGGLSIFNNTIHNDVQTINNRHRLEGMSIKSEDDAECMAPNSIHDNKIIGGAQGGILTRCKGSQIYKNDIAQNGAYTNDYAIYASGVGQDVHDNYIHPTQGRGIGTGDQDTHGTRIHHNTIVVSEQANNPEYHGCEIEGTRGIEARATFGVEIDHNTVTVKSDGCGGIGIKMVTDLGSGGKTPIQIHDNVVSTINVSGQAEQPLLAFEYDGTTAGCCIYKNNTVTADSWFAGVAWDGGDSGAFIANTYILGSNPLPPSAGNFGGTGLFFWGCGDAGARHSTRGWVFRDMAYQNGANPLTRMLTSSAGCPISYSTTWSYTVSVVEQSTNKPLAGATVSAFDSAGSRASAKTDASGQATLVLLQEQVSNDSSRAEIRENHNPQQLSISLPGCTTSNYSFSIAQRTQETRKLQCP